MSTPADIARQGASARRPNAPRRWLRALGADAIARWRGTALVVGLTVAVFLTLFRPSAWRRTSRAEFVRQFYYAGITALPSTLLAAALIGLVMVFQAIYWLQLFGQSRIIGQFLVLVLVREVGPLVVGLILVGRSGTAALVELLEFRRNGQLAALDGQGIDPFKYLLVPRVLAFASSAFALTIFFVLAALVAGNVGANLTGLANLTLGEFADGVLHAMGTTEYLTLVLKPLAIGYTVGIVVMVVALGADRNLSVYRVLSRGFMRSVLAVLLVSGLITVAL